MERKKTYIMYFLDTHIVVWLYQNTKLISKKQLNAINENKVFISPIVLLELEYLFEIKRITETSENLFDYMNKNIGLEIDNSDYLKLTNISIQEKWTRDPFDRLIVSHCKLKDAFLLTNDKLIIKNYFITV